MILVFCAFGAELAPLRARLRNEVELKHPQLRGFRGRLGKRDVTIAVSGVGIRRARMAAALALDQLDGIESVLLTGVAGGLRDDLKIGDVVVGDRLMLRHEETLEIEHQMEVEGARVEALAAAMRATGIVHARGPMLTSRRAIANAADKRRAHDTLGAIAVDMETAVIAREAAQRRIPFVALRTIMDTAAQNLEGAMLADEDGRVRAMRAAGALLRNPRMIAASIRLMRNLRAATSSMTIAVEAALAADHTLRD